MSLPTWGLDPKARTITVYYEGSDTLYEGYALCYNQDTTTNWMGVSSYNFTSTASSITESSTTAEGSQNEGKFIRVEQPATANLQWFAGVVVGNSKGIAGPCAVDIYIPNGACVPVYTNKSCTIGQSLGINNGSYVLQAVTGDGTPVPCARVEETVDRSGTNGIALARLYPTGQQVTGTGAYFAPVRSSATSGREYGVTIDGDNFLTGTTAAQSYLLYVSGDKNTNSTGDSYSALAYFTGNNYGANDTNYTLRSLNVAINNRSGGTLGQMYGASIGAQGKSGGTCQNIVALTLHAENYGTVAASFGGIDLVLTNEAAVATAEYGIQIRNTNNSIAGPVNTVLKVSKSGANTGFTNFLNVPTAGDLGIIAASGDITFDTSDKLIPISVGGSTYYLVATDNA